MHRFEALLGSLPADCVLDGEVAIRRGGKSLPEDQVHLLQQSRGLTREAMEKLPEGAYRRSVRRLDYPDLPRARLARRRCMRCAGHHG